MSCNAIQEKIYQLQRCGCGRCRREYEEFRYKHYRDNDFLQHDYYTSIPMIIKKETISMSDIKAIEAPKVAEEPKNIAHKLLVDKLKVEQNQLNANEQSITAYKNYLKTYTIAKAKNQKSIKELSDALKKLGYKEKE